MEKFNIVSVDFDKISLLPGACHLGDEFLMVDNLSGEQFAGGAEGLYCRCPVKSTTNTVYFCVAGSLEIKVNLCVYRLSANDALTILAGCVMEVLDAAEDTRVAVISFSDKYFTPFDHMEEFMGIGSMLYASPLIHLSEETMGECIDIYSRMKAKLRQEDNPFRRFALKSYSYVLCATALEQLVRLPAAKISGSDRPMDLYNRFMELLQKDFRRHRTITHYARALNISPKYFSSLVKKVSGRTAGEWIDEYVLLEARALLKCRRYTIQQVSDMLSFPNQSFFAKYFKAHTGYTPTRYQSSDS